MQYCQIRISLHACCFAPMLSSYYNCSRCTSAICILHHCWRLLVSSQKFYLGRNQLELRWDVEPQLIQLLRTRLEKLWQHPFVVWLNIPHFFVQQARPRCQPLAMFALVSFFRTIILLDSHRISVLEPTLQYVCQRDEAPVCVCSKTLRKERSLYVSNRIPWSKGVSMVYQHDERRCAFGRVKKVWTHSSTNFIFQLGGSLLSNELG